MSSEPPRRIIPIQVESPSSLGAAQRAAVLAACDRLKSLPGALLPIFHAVQDALGHVPMDAVPLIAQALNLSRAEVHGVLTFYHYFRKDPPGRHVVYVCRAEACQAVGAVELASHAKKTLGIEWHESTVPSPSNRSIASEIARWALPSWSTIPCRAGSPRSASTN